MIQKNYHLFQRTISNRRSDRFFWFLILFLSRRSIRRQAKAKKSEEEVPEYEKVVRTAKDWENAGESSKMPTRRSDTGKLEKSTKSQTTSSELLKNAQQRVKERAQLQQQYKTMEKENEKRVSAAKQKRKEEARFQNQVCISIDC